MEKQKIEESRSRFIADLEDQIWRKECNSAFDETRIPPIVAERTRALDEVVKLMKPINEIEKEIKALGNGAGKDAIKKKKELKYKISVLAATKDEKGVTLKAKIDKANEVADDCEDSIDMISKRIKAARMEANGLKERVEFAKTWDNETKENAKS